MAAGHADDSPGGRRSRGAELLRLGARLGRSLALPWARLRLGWLNPLTQKWLNAVAGNSNGARHFFARAYDPATDLHLGNYGLDTINHVVWAVINHNSVYGVSVVPVGAGIVSIEHPAPNTIHLQCLGEPSVLNRIESSPDLSWTTVNTVSVLANVNGAFTYDDDATGSSKKFYRVAAYP